MTRYNQLPVSHMAESLSRRIQTLEKEVSLLRKDVKMILHLLQQKTESKDPNGPNE
jgi:hypothetical protein